MARPMPVLPDVPSTIVPPGRSNPARSASSIIFTAIRSLIELPGLNVSSLASTVALTSPLVRALIRTIGVPPMASRMVAQTFFTVVPFSVYRGPEGRGMHVPRAALVPVRLYLARPSEHGHAKMPRLIERPTVIDATGNRPKQIQDFAGRGNSEHSAVSAAPIASPGGWPE